MGRPYQGLRQGVAHSCRCSAIGCGGRIGGPPTGASRPSQRLNFIPIVAYNTAGRPLHSHRCSHQKRGQQPTSSRLPGQDRRVRWALFFVGLRQSATLVLSKTAPRLQAPTAQHCQPLSTGRPRRLAGLYSRHGASNGAAGTSMAARRGGQLPGGERGAWPSLGASSRPVAAPLACRRRRRYLQAQSPLPPALLCRAAAPCAPRQKVPPSARTLFRANSSVSLQALAHAAGPASMPVSLHASMPRPCVWRQAAASQQPFCLMRAPPCRQRMLLLSLSHGAGQPGGPKPLASRDRPRASAAGRQGHLAKHDGEAFKPPKAVHDSRRRAAA